MQGYSLVVIFRFMTGGRAQKPRAAWRRSRCSALQRCVCTDGGMYAADADEAHREVSGRHCIQVEVWPVADASAVQLGHTLAEVCLIFFHHQTTTVIPRAGRM